jgi:hypothetical protein
MRIDASMDCAAEKLTACVRVLGVTLQNQD